MRQVFGLPQSHTHNASLDIIVFISFVTDVVGNGNGHQWWWWWCRRPNKMLMSVGHFSQFNVWNVYFLFAFCLLLSSSCSCPGRSFTLMPHRAFDVSSFFTIAILSVAIRLPSIYKRRNFYTFVKICSMPSAVVWMVTSRTIYGKKKKWWREWEEVANGCSERKKNQTNGCWSGRNAESETRWLDDDIKLP